MKFYNPPLALYVQTSLVNFMYNANTSFPLKIETGAEQTGSDDLGRYWASTNGNS